MLTIEPTGAVLGATARGIDLAQPSTLGRLLTGLGLVPDQVRGLFSYHDGGGVRIAAHNARHRRGIHDPQAIDALIRCGVAGSRVTPPGMPIASSIAAAIAAPTPVMPPSPTLLMPSGLSGLGASSVTLETRHVRDAFKSMPVKTDRKDARGIAQLMRLGWFRPVHCKCAPC